MPEKHLRKEPAWWRRLADTLAARYGENMAVVDSLRTHLFPCCCCCRMAGCVRGRDVLEE